MRPVKAAQAVKGWGFGFGLGALRRMLARRGSTRTPLKARPGPKTGGRRAPLPRKALRAERRTFSVRLAEGRGFGGLGHAAAVGILAGALGYGLALGGHLPTARAGAAMAWTGATRLAGFGLTDVRVDGAQRASPVQVAEIMGLSPHASLLAFDAQAARQRLLATPWIKDATVRLFLPGTVAVRLAEREPYAIWQRAGHVALVDREGRDLGPYDDIRYSHLPVVVGEGAEKRVGEIGHIIEEHPAIRSRVRAAVLVAERRWTLKLGDGVDIMLPEVDAGQAVALLARLDRETGLLNRDIAAVDMRLSDRVVVRLTERARTIRAEALRTRTRQPATPTGAAPVRTLPTAAPQPPARGRVT